MNLDARTHVISHPLATYPEVGSQCEMVDTTHFSLTIPNPDDFYVPPIYTGDPAKAHEVLEPGTYKGIIENWAMDTSVDVVVYVYQHFTNLRRFTLAGEWR